MTITMPRVSFPSNVSGKTTDVELTKPSAINAGNPSVFPKTVDEFKTLTPQTPNMAVMQEYYGILAKVIAGTAQQADFNKLQNMSSTIRDYVLTDEDYNKMVGALKEVEAYVLRFMYNDITAKATAMDNEINKVLNDINTFMTDLETKYNNSAVNFPAPDGSLMKQKLSDAVQGTLTYTEQTASAVIANSQPSAPSGKSFLWFNTGAPI